MPRQAQLVKPQIKPTVKTKEFEAVKQGIKQDESLEIIQTLLGASFGCLSFLRGLLPEESFEEVRYGSPDCPLASYNWFANSDEPESNYSQTKEPVKGTRMKRLKRGYSSEADHLLNWLEQGIFDALRQKYLKAMQLAIYIDPAQPEIITEAYTFSFAYHMSSDGTPGSATGFNVKDHQGNLITVSNTSRSIQQVMRRLIMITQNLPTLPNTRYLTLRLHYTEWTPENYSPPYFRRTKPEEGRLRFREETGDSFLQKIMCGSIATGHHGVSLKVAAFHEPDETQVSNKRPRTHTTNLDEDIEIPSLNGDMADNSASSLPGDKLFSQPDVQKTSGMPNPKSLESAAAIISSTPKPSQKEKKRSVREQIEASKLQQMLHSPQYLLFSRNSLVETQQDLDDSQNSSQQITDLHLAKDLYNGNFLRRPADIASPTPNPGEEHLKLPATIAKQSAEVTKFPLGRQQLQTTQLTLPAIPKIKKLKLSGGKLTELKKAKELKRLKENPQNSKNSGQNTEPDVVVCECGDREDGDMISCDLCEGWVHIHCYGYTYANDPRIPDCLVCYSCLLTNEQALLEKMKSLALFRRGLKIVWETGYPANIKKLAELIGSDIPSATEVFQKLKREGFIHALSNGGRKKASPIKYVVSKTDENKQKMDVEYFDPLTNISHHFEIPESLVPVEDASLLDTFPPQQQTLEGDTTADENYGESTSIRKPPRAGKISLAKGKQKTSVIPPQNIDFDYDEMDLDLTMDNNASQQLKNSASSSIQKTQAYCEPSPWRKHVGICEEGICFDAVF